MCRNQQSLTRLNLPEFEKMCFTNKPKLRKLARQAKIHADSQPEKKDYRQERRCKVKHR